MNSSVPDRYVIRLLPIAGCVIVGMGGLFFLLEVLSFLGVGNNKLPFHIQLLILLGSIVALAAGAYLIKNPGDRLRLERDQLVLANKKKSIPWKHIEHAHASMMDGELPVSEQSAALLILRLTPEGRQATGKRVLDSGLGSLVRDDDDVALRMMWWRFGSEVPSGIDLVNEINRRVAMAKGEVAPVPQEVHKLEFDESLTPDPAAPLVQ
ncbi:MAG: hypothetical protein AAF497_09900, partial [Planctomycetota bacterium]